MLQMPPAVSLADGNSGTHGPHGLLGLLRQRLPGRLSHEPDLRARVGRLDAALTGVRRSLGRLDQQRSAPTPVTQLLLDELLLCFRRRDRLNRSVGRRLKVLEQRLGTMNEH